MSRESRAGAETAATASPPTSRRRWARALHRLEFTAKVYDFSVRRAIARLVRCRAGQATASAGPSSAREALRARTSLSRRWHRHAAAEQLSLARLSRLLCGRDPDLRGTARARRDRRAGRLATGFASRGRSRSSPLRPPGTLRGRMAVAVATHPPFFRDARAHETSPSPSPSAPAAPLGSPPAGALAAQSPSPGRAYGARVRHARQRMRRVSADARRARAPECGYK